MKTRFTLSALLFLMSSTAFAQATITLGCFRFGPEICDPMQNPPTITLPPGFHMGPVDPMSPGENPPVPHFKVLSNACGNGIGPSLPLGGVVEFAAGPAAVVINETAYLVGANTDGTNEEGKYISASEFGVVSYGQDGKTVAAVDIKFNAQTVVIKSASPAVGTCVLEAAE